MMLAQLGAGWVAWWDVVKAQRQLEAEQAKAAALMVSQALTETNVQIFEPSPATPSVTPQPSPSPLTPHPGSSQAR